MFRKISIIFILLCLINANAQSSFIFQNQKIKPGSKHHFLIPITTGKDSSFVPITVFNGIKDGKTIGITAGIHGYEYSPIIASQKLINSIDVKKLSGVVILVQIANLESFLGRTAYKSPIDGKNLNRTFPGKADGTNTEKVADFITKKIIARSDYFLDIHSGDAPEDLMPYSAYYSNKSMPEVSETGRKMAEALGYNYNVIFNTNGKKYMEKNEPSLYTTAEAFKRGIPSVDIECGRLGLVEYTNVNNVEDSVLRLLDHLSFLPYNKMSKRAAIITISDRDYIDSEFDGIFYPSKKAGELVKKGTKLGHITNYFGEIIQTVYAENDGFIMMIMTTPPIKKGEGIVVIGKV
ncbi:succinylglutamate desuccinylase/aspartoacylase family protein [Chryseobacterium sp. CP-77]|uniref:succinylglutamate desuccinylase/aspartoacylase family protein n=1 Tax=Chryseobacterium sp. CP-77 TaxID=3116594 RepID=UPI002ED5652B